MSTTILQKDPSPKPKSDEIQKENTFTLNNESTENLPVRRFPEEDTIKEEMELEAYEQPTSNRSHGMFNFKDPKRPRKRDV